MTDYLKVVSTADSEVVLHREMAELEGKKARDLNKALDAAKKEIIDEKNGIIEWIIKYKGTRPDLRNQLRMRFKTMENTVNQLSTKLISIRDHVQLGSIAEDFEFFNDFKKIAVLEVPNSITLETVVIQLRDIHLQKMANALIIHIAEHPEKNYLTSCINRCVELVKTEFVSALGRIKLRESLSEPTEGENSGDKQIAGEENSDTSSLHSTTGISKPLVDPFALKMLHRDGMITAINATARFVTSLKDVSSIF